MKLASVILLDGKPFSTTKRLEMSKLFPAARKLANMFGATAVVAQYKIEKNRRPLMVGKKTFQPEGGEKNDILVGSEALHGAAA